MSGIIDTLTTQQQLELIYIGYFNRAADDGGFNFWEGQNVKAQATVAAGGFGQSAAVALSNIANSFAPQPEAEAIYPFLTPPINLSNESGVSNLVINVYANLFDRTVAATDGGVLYWVGKITSGAVAIGDAILAIANGATGADAIELQNKIEVALDFTTRTAAAGLGTTAPLSAAFVAEATTVLNGVDNVALGDASVTAAEAVTTAYINNQQTFTLTVGTDSAITGQPFDGTGAVVPASNVLINGPLAVLGSGVVPTLTAGDTIELAGSNNSLNAFFNAATTVVALTVEGVQTFSFTQTVGGTVTLLGVGGPNGFFGPSTVGGANGLQTINVQNGVAGTLQIGTTGGGGIKSLLTGTAAAPAINVEDNASGTSVVVFESASLFAGTPTLFVATNNAATPGGGTLFNVGGDNGTAGYTHWVVQDQDSTTDVIFLGQQGSNAATSLTVTGANGAASGATLMLEATGGGGQWAGLTKLDGSLVSGELTVTGNEIGAAGLLDNNNAITSISGGPGGSFFDLTSLGTATADAVKVNGGSGLGEVAFTNAVMIQGLLGAPIALTNIDIVDDASGAPGGTINMANFPLVLGGLAGTAELQFVSGSGGTSGFALGGNLVISNGPTDFGVQFNEMGFGASVNSVSITAGLANINGGNDIAKIGMSDVGSPTIFTVNNYTVTDLLLPTNGSTVFGSSADVLFSDTPAAGATGAAVNISDNGSGTPDALLLGNVDNSLLDVAKVGVATVDIDATTTPITITDNGHGLFVIGGTNVTNLNAQSTSELIMDAPATGGGVNSGFEFAGATAGSAGVAGTPFFENPILNYGITVNGATGGADLLQGVSGPLTAGLVNAAFIGGVGSSSITGSNVGGDNIFPEGGNTTVTLGAGHGTSDTVWFGFYDLGAFLGGGPNTIVDQAITDIHNGGEIGVNAYLGILSNVTTINNFNIGAGGDVIKFGPNDWVGTSLFVALASGGGDYGLWNAGILGAVVPGASALKLVTAPDTPITTAVSITLDGITTYTGATQLQSQLVLAGVGDLDFGGGVSPLDGHNIIHELVAYQVKGTNNINIADVELINTTANPQSGDTANSNLVVSVHDLVHLVGVGLLGNLNTDNFAFHA
jgi:hypothetical protein